MMTTSDHKPVDGATPLMQPCPWCGGAASIEEIGEFDVRFGAGCSNEDCIGFQSLITFSRRCEAISAWNRRPSAGKVEEAVDLEKIQQTYFKRGWDAAHEVAAAELLELTKALTGLTCGGSEFFAGKRSDGSYKPDIRACVEYVRRLQREGHERFLRAIRERDEARQALSNLKEQADG